MICVQGKAFHPCDIGVSGLESLTPVTTSDDISALHKL